MDSLALRLQASEGFVKFSLVCRGVAGLRSQQLGETGIYKHACLHPENTRHVSLIDAVDSVCCHLPCGNKHKLTCPTLGEDMMHFKTGSIQLN